MISIDMQPKKQKAVLNKITRNKNFELPGHLKKCP